MMAVAFWPRHGGRPCRRCRARRSRAPWTPARRAARRRARRGSLFEVGKDSHLPAYFDDCALVRPITCWSAAALPVTYPVDPTTRAVMRSVMPLLFTTSVCAPDVVPASPVTSSVGPVLLGGRVEVHALACRRPSGRRCTRSRAPRWWSWCWRRRPARPSGQRQCGRGGESGGDRGGAGGVLAQGVHDLHSPGGPARWRVERRLGQGWFQAHLPTSAGTGRGRRPLS